MKGEAASPESGTSPRGPPPLLETAVNDGEIDWNESEWYPIDPSNLDRDIRRRMQPITDHGIWYMSGRAFYPDEADDPLVQ